MLTTNKINYIERAITTAKAVDPSNARYFYRSVAQMLEQCRNTTNQDTWARLFIAAEQVAEERGL